MEGHIPSNITELLAITVLQNNKVGCGFAEAEKLTLVTVLLLSGTHK